jgi:hypothetical protein
MLAADKDRLPIWHLWRSRTGQQTDATKKARDRTDKIELKISSRKNRESARRLVAPLFCAAHSGSLAILAAIRGASSRSSNLAAERRPGSSSQQT